MSGFTLLCRLLGLFWPLWPTLGPGGEAAWVFLHRVQIFGNPKVDLRPGVVDLPKRESAGFKSTLGSHKTEHCSFIFSRHKFSLSID